MQPDTGGSSYPLECADITLDYGNGRGVFDINLRIDHGNTLCIVGPSGSGKTTLLKLMNGMLRPIKGQIIFQGRPLDYTQIEQERRRMGYALQGTGLFPHMNVEKNITLIAKLEKWDRRKIEDRLHKLLDLMKLPVSYRKLYPHELSGGEMQRVGLCRAMMLDPPVLLLDEAFSALDPVTRSEIHEWFLQVFSKTDNTVILITHDIQEAFRLGDMVAVIHQGRIIAKETPSSLKHYRGEDFLGNFLNTALWKPSASN